MKMKSVKFEDGMLWIASVAEESLSYLGIFTTKQAAEDYAAKLNATKQYGEIEVSAIFPNAYFAE